MENRTEIGKLAEAIAAEHLKSKGFKIIDNNWRTRWCEIDIIAVKKNIVYFCEVKYRRISEWGDGLDAITPKKLKQMQFAAEVWVQSKQWSGNYDILAISLSGQPPKVMDCLVIDGF